MKLPVVGITMGDPAGVGPEVVMKALARPDAYAFCRPLVIGDLKRLEKAGAIAGARPEKLDCIDLGLVPEDFPRAPAKRPTGISSTQ
jgi:4-hydroxy-L-threonine phosphate dehydrogenase PdxA